MKLFRYSYTVTVNGFDLFQLKVISVTVTVNLNHTARTVRKPLVAIVLSILK